MSVTFYAELSDPVAWDLECVCGELYSTEHSVFEEFIDAELALVMHRDNTLKVSSKCDEDCLLYGTYIMPIEAEGRSPDVNMSNQNSIAVLQALGLMTEQDSFEDVCCGSIDAEDFLGRILMAEAVAPISPSRATEVFTSDRGAVFVSCGVEEGYVQTKLTQLREVAAFAQLHQKKVCWA